MKEHMLFYKKRNNLLSTFRKDIGFNKNVLNNAQFLKRTEFKGTVRYGLRKYSMPLQPPTASNSNIKHTLFVCFFIIFDVPEIIQIHNVAAQVSSIDQELSSCKLSCALQKYLKIILINLHTLKDKTNLIFLVENIMLFTT